MKKLLKISAVIIFLFIGLFIISLKGLNFNKAIIETTKGYYNIKHTLEIDSINSIEELLKQDTMYSNQIDTVPHQKRTIQPVDSEIKIELQITNFCLKN